MTRYGSSSPAGVDGAAALGAGGTSAGIRRALTRSSHPSVEHGPSQVSRPGSDSASVTWPAWHVPRTRTDRFLALLTGVDSPRGRVFMEENSAACSPPCARCSPR